MYNPFPHPPDILPDRNTEKLLRRPEHALFFQMLYQMSSTDSTGKERHFEKPLFLTLLMFMAMAFALPIYYVQQVGLRPCV